MKYKFKNAEIEKALRLVANELGINDESFDKQIDEWGFADTVYMDDGNRDVLFFPTKLIEKVKVFNPNGWNDPDVIPPENPDLKWASVNLLIEDAFDKPHIGYYHYESRNWVDVRNDMNITCKRYCLYPKD